MTTHLPTLHLLDLVNILQQLPPMSRIGSVMKQMSSGICIAVQSEQNNA